MVNLNNSNILKIFLLFTSITLSSCASTKQINTDIEASYEISDPFEEVNRAVFSFNNVVDSILLEPVATGYQKVIPQTARKGVRNFLVNLRSPIDVGNQILQGDLIGAADGTTRFFVNTLLGLGGLIDIAAKEGLEHEPEDFGQTLAVWGVGDGPYTVLPLIGPNNLRDQVGLLADSYVDPIRLYLHNTNREEIYYSKLSVKTIDTREELLTILSDLKNNSIDYYAAVRSVIYQRRNALISDMSEEDRYSAEMPDFEDEEW